MKFREVIPPESDWIYNNYTKLYKPESEIPISPIPYSERGIFFGTTATNAISQDIKTWLNLLSRPGGGFNSDLH